MKIFRFSAEWFPQDPNRKRYILLFIAIICVGSIFRLSRIDAQSLWFDELHSIIPTDPSNTFSSVIGYTFGSDQPPLFFVMLYGWYKVFPYDEASGKLFCAILGILGVISMYFLGKEYHTPKTGLVSALLTSCNLFHIYYSQELRFYSLLFLLSSVSFLIFLRFCRQQTISNMIAFVLVTTCLLYTHHYGNFLVLSQAIIFVFVIVYYEKSMSFFLRGLVCAVVSLLAYSPWIPIILRDTSITSFWIVDPGPWFVAEYFNRYFNGWWGLALKEIFSSILFAMILVYFWGFAADLRRNKRNEGSMPQIILLGWALLTLLLPYLFTIYKIPILQDRYTIITLPALLVMIAMGWDRIKIRAIKWALVILFVFFTWRADQRYYTRFKKPQYRELSQAIIEGNVDHAPVLSLWAWHFDYYFRKFNSGYRVTDLNYLDSANWMAGVDRFWVIFPQYHLTEAQLGVVNANYRIEREITLVNANATLFRRKDDLN